jgi:hypothetical protein
MDDQPFAPHMMAALYPRMGADAVPQPPFFAHATPGAHAHAGGMLQPGAMGQHPMPLWPHMPPPGAPPMPMLPPPGMGMHGHDGFGGHTPVFGDFADLRPANSGAPPPGYAGHVAAPLQAGAVPRTQPPVPTSAVPGESSPPVLDEQELVDVFIRGAPLSAGEAVSPDALLARVEASFLRPHSWGTHYAGRFGTLAEFVEARPESFAITHEGRVHRRVRAAAPAQMVNAAPPIQMMITPLAPHVRAAIAPAMPYAPAPTMQAAGEASGDAFDARGAGKQGRGNGGAATGAGGRRSSARGGGGRGSGGRF